MNKQKFEKRLEQAKDLNFVKATVTNIVDGDTIVVCYDGITEQIQMIGVDTPERNQVGFNEATNFTRNQIEKVGNIVYLQSSDGYRDRFGRLRRYVWLGMPRTPINSVDRSKLLLNQVLKDNGYGIALNISR